jgi:hypothetical protein
LDSLEIVDANFTVRGDNIDGEIDIVAIERSRLGRTGLVVGECRTENRFTEDDVSKLEAIAAKVRGAGIDCYPLFATLRDGFMDAELALFKALRDRERYGEFVVARPPILLTRADLERGDFAESDQLPRRTNLGDLAGLAAASNAIYL